VKQIQRSWYDLLMVIFIIGSIQLRTGELRLSLFVCCSNCSFCPVTSTKKVSFMPPFVGLIVCQEDCSKSEW